MTLQEKSLDMLDMFTVRRNFTGEIFTLTFVVLYHTQNYEIIPKIGEDGVQWDHMLEKPNFYNVTRLRRLSNNLGTDSNDRKQEMEFMKHWQESRVHFHMKAQGKQEIKFD